MVGKLILEDGSEFDGKCFGAEKSVAGEVVFSTGMVGYPESLTDPSYTGQILITTYPLIGNYGVPDKKYWESDSVKISSLIVSNYIDTPSHSQSKRSLGQWLKDENIPGLEIADTRYLTQKIREKGTMLGKIVIDKDINLYDPNKENLVAKVSTKKVTALQDVALQRKTVLIIDCGMKANIKRSFLKRGVNVIIAPWDFDPFEKIHPGGVMPFDKLRAATPGVGNKHLRGGRMPARQMPGMAGGDSSEVDRFDALFISNGPGDPKMADKTIQTIKKTMNRKIPILGICLGHQLLALAAGGDTSKLKYGHRSQNQPCLLEESKRCYITSQNHGFEVTKIPPGFKKWFTNANDGSNEGIIHTKYPFMSVQFHPEACPGPVDTEWIFDYFLKKIDTD